MYINDKNRCVKITINMLTAMSIGFGTKWFRPSTMSILFDTQLSIKWFWE